MGYNRDSVVDYLAYQRMSLLVDRDFAGCFACQNRYHPDNNWDFADWDFVVADY